MTITKAGPVAVGCEDKTHRFTTFFCKQSIRTAFVSEGSKCKWFGKKTTFLHRE